MCWIQVMQNPVTHTDECHSIIQKLIKPDLLRVIFKSWHLKQSIFHCSWNLKHPFAALNVVKCWVLSGVILETCLRERCLCVVIKAITGSQFTKRKWFTITPLSSVLSKDTPTSDNLLQSQDHLKTATCSIGPPFLPLNLVKEGFLQALWCELQSLGQYYPIIMLCTSCISRIHTRCIMWFMCVVVTQRLFEITRDCSFDSDQS